MGDVRFYLQTPVPLMMGNSSHLSLGSMASSTTNLLPDDSVSMRRADSYAPPSRSGHGSARPMTRYEDFMVGQEKLATTQAQTYDIMPDMALLSEIGPEKDDALHDPGKIAPRRGADRRIGDSPSFSQSGAICSSRGFLNAGSLLIIMLALIAVFAGLPISQWIIRLTQPDLGAFNIGGTNASGMVPSIEGYHGLIDMDTPQSVYERKGYDGEDYVLVFSDEFNIEGRTFWPGDDPYWESANSHYYATNNLEFYDPRGSTTRDGYLQFNMTEQNPRTNHGFNYSSGMIMTWNKVGVSQNYRIVVASDS